jgi:hypothetical protein
MRLGSSPHNRRPHRHRGDPLSEDGERLAFEGPRGRQGNQGNRGEQGASGLSAIVRRGLVYLFMLSALFGAFNLFWTAHEVHSSQSAIQAAQHREQVMQQQAGAVLGRKLCATFGALAALKPPPGNPRVNPARAYEQEEHATLDQLGTDLGCK